MAPRKGGKKEILFLRIKIFLRGRSLLSLLDGFFLNGAKTLKRVDQATIVNYLQGGNTQSNNKVLIRIEGITSDREAARFVGRRCIWESSTGKRLTGKMIRAHGKNGILLVRFAKGIPGQALGTPVILK